MNAENNPIFAALQNAGVSDPLPIVEIISDLEANGIPNPNEARLRAYTFMQAAALCLSSRAREMLYDRNPNLLRQFDELIQAFNELLAQQSAPTQTRALASQITSRCEEIF